MDTHEQHRQRRIAQAESLLQLPDWGDTEADQAVGLHDLLEDPDAGPMPVVVALRRRLVPALRDFYQRRHGPMDLVRAEIFATGVLDQPAGLARRLHTLRYLGLARFADFQSGAMTALDETIDAYSELDRAVRSAGAPAEAILGEGYYGALDGLAAALIVRYRSRRELLLLDVAQAERAAIRADLDTAIRISRRVMRSGSGFALAAQVALGTSLTMAAEDDPDLINEAVRLLEDALSRTGASAAPGQWEMQIGTADRLASALQQRGGLADIDRAIEVLNDCCEQTGPGSIYAAGGRMGLASARLRRWLLTQNEADERVARSAHRDAWQAGLRHHLPAAFDAAAQHGGWAWTRGRWEEAGEAYGRAVRVLHIAARSLASWPDKQLIIRKAPEVAARAAYGLARHGEDEAALVALETGRAVVLAEVLDRRSVDYEAIARAAGPDAAREYKNLTNQLTELEALSLAEGDSTGPRAAAPAATARRRLENLRHDRDLLIKRYAGNYPGASLAPSAPPGAAELRSAAGPFPVIHLAATSQGGLAVLVPPRNGAVRAIELPGLTVATAQSAAATFWDAVNSRDVLRCEEVCQAIWSLAVGHLVPHLDGAERVVLVPGGVLAALPWHAAQIPDRHQRHLLDMVAVSYAPNIRALAAARAAAIPFVGPLSMLAIDQPEPTRQPRLETATELAAIRAQQSSTFQVTELAGRDATRAAVLGALSQYQAIHFAGHARTRPEDPLASALLTARDEPLTVRDLLTRGVGATRLAVLSACETARVGDELTDEMISLPTALLQCGLSGVVASLWQVFDKPTATIMDAFYENWREEGLTPVLALRAAQLWARDRGYPSPLAWASFVYEGP